MSTFYFHWVDPTDTTFGPSFITNDEQVFSVSIQHSEGDFPSMDIDLVNPRVGLLGAGRKQWAWLSWTDDSNVNHPLFFGRLLGAPQSMQADIVRLTFIARPLDYEAQRAAILATAVSSSPVYDPVWLADDELENPDTVLETIPALWHIDRTTLVVTTSDIIEGEDGTVNFPDADVFEDSLDVTYSESPASKCIVTATVNWTQRGAGSFPIFDQVVQAFADGHVTSGLISIRNNPMSGDGMIACIPGEALVQNWPKPGTEFGGGWKVKASSAAPVGGTPPSPVLVNGYDNWLRILDLVDSSNPLLQSLTMRAVFDTAPGFVVQVTPTWIIPTPYGTAHGDVDILWFPIWRIAGSLDVAWDAARPRQEVVTFTLEADVQPLLTDPDGQEVIRLNLGPVDVDEVIEHIQAPRFFNGPAGKHAFQSLVARARAALLARARAVEIQFDTSFEKAITLSCRMNATLSDPRLPGTDVGGKIKSYTITMDGDSGTLIGHVTVGAVVGHDGTVSIVGGTPDYVDPDYVEDYQEYIGSTAQIPGYTDLTYGGLDNYAFDDDGVVLTNVNRHEYLESITIEGTIDEQQPAAQGGGSVASAVEVIAKVSGFTTTITVRMKPISDNAFLTNIAPTVSVLKVPKTIDTEAV